MSTNLPIKGQRWVSDSEPELGLGIILQTESDRVKVFFPAVSGLRKYALESAPLRRVQFKEGDTSCVPATFPPKHFPRCRRPE